MAGADELMGMVAATDKLAGARRRTGSAAPAGPRPRALVGPHVLIWFYRRWLRKHLVQELLAGLGVAIAVALVFATIVAAGSVSGSSTAAARTVIGPATLQLHSRSADGISGTLLRRVQELPGVRTAGSLLEATATLRTASGRTATIDLAGAGTSLVFMDGLAHTIPTATLSARGIGLSSRTAGELAIGGSARASHGKIEVNVRGRAVSMPISAVLGQEAFGALSQTSVAVMQLRELQQLTGLSDRVSRILVQPRRGHRAQVRKELRTLAHGRVDVAPADQDVGLLAQALGPSNQASALFATISALLGMLLAMAAFLLTAPDRRRAIADLRLMGIQRTAIVEMFAFQALLLGCAASLLGLLGGYALSVTVLAVSSRYLAEAFTLGTQTRFDGIAIAAALATGLLSSCLASTMPLLDLRSGETLRSLHRHGIPGNTLRRRTRRALDAGVLTLIVAAGAIVAIGPSLALPACILLALATVCALPLALSVAIRLGMLLSRWWESLTALPVAVSSLQATTLRSVALAATGAVALFGSVALGGARADLAHGIGGFAHSYASDATLWIGSRGDDQGVIDFPKRDLPAQIARVPGVAHVAAYAGGFAVMDGRRVWVIARPPGGARHVLASQILHGSAALAERRLAQGGWVVVSQQIAEHQHVGVGARLLVPTPSGEVSLRIAALSTNLAWSPGALFIGSGEYARLWQSRAATALGISLRPGASVKRTAQLVRETLGPSSSLTVRTDAALEASIETLASEGLGQLREISNLLLLAAILAMAAAITAAVWQRRGALAGLRLCGVSSGRLRRILLVEASLMLSAGCITGAFAGVCGQAIIDRYLGSVTGFPIATIASDARPLKIFALVLAAVFAAACMPILAASRVSPSYALVE
ncbi:MAG TPA: FtsX-like permease family protein [Solirubrobacteraceae bacterium]|jgi:putative ABC transport system permease protein